MQKHVFIYLSNVITNLNNNDILWHNLRPVYEWSKISMRKNWDFALSHNMVILK